MQELRYFSAFSGIGGFELGLEEAFADNQSYPKEIAIQSGIPRSRNCTLSLYNRTQWSRTMCVGYSEIEPSAQTIYQKHFPKHQNFGDITKIETERLPDFELLCAGFPCQAFSIAGRRKGFSDQRGALFFELTRIIKEKRPRILLLENVKGLLSHDEGRTFTTILSSLVELGYELQWQVCNSADFGLAQNRERIYIIGHIRGKPRPAIFPLTGTIEETIRDFERADCQNLPAYIRRLTPVECERVQGFPDRWTEGLDDASRYSVLGNAVSPPVVREIVKRIFC